MQLISVKVQLSKTTPLFKMSSFPRGSSDVIMLTYQHYFMKDSKLSTTKEEKDLGVLITDNLKPSSQCTAAVNKTMSALRWSKRSFHYLDIESFRILYKTYIRPNLEFVIQAWSPYLDKDIKIMEKIQRQATKMVPALFNLQYEDRLKKLGI